MGNGDKLTVHQWVVVTPNLDKSVYKVHIKHSIIIVKTLPPIITTCILVCPYLQQNKYHPSCLEKVKSYFDSPVHPWVFSDL